MHRPITRRTKLAGTLPSARLFYMATERTSPVLRLSSTSTDTAPPSFAGQGAWMIADIDRFTQQTIETYVLVNVSGGHPQFFIAPGDDGSTKLMGVG